MAAAVLAAALVLPLQADPAPHFTAVALTSTVTSTIIQSVEFRAAGSAAADDRLGWMPSLYRGQWYAARFASVRRCIMTRESHINYRAKNRSSSAAGAYQFLDRSWRDGLVWMFLRESAATGDGLAGQARALRQVPIDHWSRYWQDRAFYTAWRFGAGAFHWRATVAGTGC